ncbi:unnamed protein product [Durusdinium trenchii]|uniref:Uncharacterized protein n=1 Tax=Durusdinium trenchii TaxID=1381693 RepID=A0ABP0N1Y5_9DINO
MGCHASKVQDETCVTWKDTHGFVSRESSVEGPSPRLSFRSMDGVRIYREGDAPLPPMRSTHQRHLTKFDSFLQKLDQNKLDQLIHQKRRTHARRQEKRWSQMDDSLEVSLSI